MDDLIRLSAVKTVLREINLIHRDLPLPMVVLLTGGFLLGCLKTPKLILASACDQELYSEALRDEARRQHPGEPLFGKSDNISPAAR